MSDIDFFEYISNMLRETGHMVTSTPKYINHSYIEALYIDSNKNVVVSSAERELLATISNVSLVEEIEWQESLQTSPEKVQIFSITTNYSRCERSQNIADVHDLLQKYWTNNHSIVFFKNEDQFIISFADAIQSHILSDWFDIDRDYDKVVDRLSIENMSLDSSSEYFNDFIFALAREYYIHPISFEGAAYGTMPLDLLASKYDPITGVAYEADVEKDDIQDIIRANLAYYSRLYGDDYVEPKYDGIADIEQYRNMTDEIDRISLELDLAAKMDEEPIESFSFDDEDDDLDENDSLDDIDPAIFEDPVLMVEWLEKKQAEKDKRMAQQIQEIN